MKISYPNILDEKKLIDYIFKNTEKKLVACLNTVTWEKKGELLFEVLTFCL